ncbi:putative Transporter [Gammaproteobacteria bacterium]
MKNFKKIIFLTVIATTPCFSSAEETSSNEPSFVPGRPGNTESAIAVPKGYFQIESGLVNYTRDKVDDERTKFLSLAQTAFRYGIAEGTDVQLVIQPYSKLNISGAGIDQTFQGFGNTTLRVLHTFLGADGNSPSFGIIGFITLPSADKELKDNGVFDDRTTGGVVATGSINLTDKASVTLTLGDGTKHSSGSSYLNDIYGGINLTYALTEQFSTYIEAYGDHVKNSQTQSTIDLGMTYLLSHVTQLDAGVNIAANHAAPDASFFIGWSHRF